MHPSGDAGGPPHEEWLYHKIEGVGDNVIIRFVDEKRDGHYRMTSGSGGPRAVGAAAAATESGSAGHDATARAVQRRLRIQGGL